MLLSPIVVLVGKILFLVLLYGFLYAIYKGLMAEARRGGRPEPARVEVERATVGNWELRPAGAGPPVVRPVPTVSSATEGPVPAAGPVTTPSAPLPAVAAEGPVAPPQLPTTTKSSGAEPASAAGPQTPLPALLAEGSTPAVESAPPMIQESPPVLVVLGAPQAGIESGHRFVLKRGPGPEEVTRIGRSEDSDIILRDRFVSAHHCEIVCRGNQVLVRDLGSTNGTFRNGVRISGQTPLLDGDRLGIGTTVFAFHQGR